MNKRLYFQVKTEAKDSFNALKETWIPDFDVWGEMRITGSVEEQGEMKRDTRMRATFRLWSRDGIDPNRHRIVTIDNERASPAVSRIWNISTPYDPDGRRADLVIDAVSAVYPTQS
jgi:hypothetical protein